MNDENEIDNIEDFPEEASYGYLDEIDWILGTNEAYTQILIPF